MNANNILTEVRFALNDTNRKYYQALNLNEHKLKNKDLDIMEQCAEIDFWLYENKSPLFREFKKNTIPKLPKRGTQSFKILVLLILQENVSNGQMIQQRILRYGARITDLRNMGWDIVANRKAQGKGTFLYSLSSEQSHAVERLISEIHVENN